MLLIPGNPLYVDLDTSFSRPRGKPDIKGRLPAFGNLDGTDTGNNFGICHAETPNLLVLDDYSSK
jgi:hypothetical protein